MVSFDDFSLIFSLNLDPYNTADSTFLSMYDLEKGRMEYSQAYQVITKDKNFICKAIEVSQKTGVIFSAGLYRNEMKTRSFINALDINNEMKELAITKRKASSNLKRGFYRVGIIEKPEVEYEVLVVSGWLDLHIYHFSKAHGLEHVHCFEGIHDGNS